LTQTVDCNKNSCFLIENQSKLDFVGLLHLVVIKKRAKIAIRWTQPKQSAKSAFLSKQCLSPKMEKSVIQILERKAFPIILFTFEKSLDRLLDRTLQPEATDRQQARCN